MPWIVKKVGSKYQVVKKDGGAVVGTHSSRTQAIQHMRALYANVKE